MGVIIYLSLLDVINWGDNLLSEQADSTVTSVHPETVFLPNLCIILKILSPEHQLYAWGKIFSMPWP
jgi:hypothetical protein